MREFETGATRNVDTNKFDIEGFLSPAVIERYCAYMHKHRFQADGQMREADNWQKGIPKSAYVKSGFRHFFDWWKEHRGIATAEGMEEALCALIFNAMGYLHEHLKARAASTAQDPPIEPWATRLGATVHVPASITGQRVHTDQVTEHSTPTHADGYSGPSNNLSDAQEMQEWADQAATLRASGPCDRCGSTLLLQVPREVEIGTILEIHCKQCGRGR